MMISLFFYLLKVVFCSAVLGGYYFLALKNKLYHQYNRFYILFLFIASWLIPLCNFSIKPLRQNSTVVESAIQNIAITNSNFEDVIFQHSSNEFKWETIAVSCFWLICTFLFILALVRFVKLLLLTHKHKKISTNPIVFTDLKGTPFSFFKYIFWDNSLDIHLPISQQILLHELEHVNQKHSVDKLIVELIMTVGWINPIFWLARKELFLIHEFMADKRAVQQGNVAQLAQLLLISSYPTKYHLFTNSFFFSPIKRRLTMISKKYNSQFVHYVQKLLVLPLAALIIVLVSFKQTNKIPINYIGLQKTYTVVIDASHGGEDFGAKASDGTTEKEISLQLALAIKAANKNPNLNIILTRETDVFQNVKEKATLTNNLKPDLFVSLHANDALPNTNLSGFEIYIATEKNAFSNKSERLAQYVSINLPNELPNRGIKKRNAGIYVLKAVEAPSILFEAGFLNNSKDLNYIKNENSQTILVSKLIQGIEQYLVAEEQINKNGISNIYQLTNDNQDDSKQGASSEEMDLYATYVKQNFGEKVNGKLNPKNFINGSEGLPKDVKDKMVSIYLKMNKEQKAQQTICFRKHPGYSRKEVPTQEQLTNWLKPTLYGVWIDDVRVKNEVLKKYKPSDFSLYFASKLAKNAINYPNHKVQINLMTNNFYESYVNETKQKMNDYIIIYRYISK